MRRNRVAELVAFWGEEAGLGMAMFHLNESANKRSKAKWVREFEAYFAGVAHPVRKPVPATFNDGDIIRCHGLGIGSRNNRHQ